MCEILYISYLLDYLEVILTLPPRIVIFSLISALAAASGHHLVRINLSEQTDISDLMGSDLPMPEETTDENGNTSAGGSFKWCDGALLKAIKNGDWVLLDELNLASQSVLEGLNSCLDHRASVYIPELGQTFDCPPTFRIFAAQNPLAQGGGRKGLPKSFLNRFTKVYVEALTKGDLQGIVTSKFPMLPPSLVENIVRFNDFVQADIANRMYGQLGSPWEFNLRDVFRWCDLIRNHYTSTGQIEYGAFSDTIYMQRLRSDRDRSLLAKRYEDCFGNRDCIRNDPRVDCKENVVRVGIARLDRNVGILPPSDSIILGSEPSLLRNLVRPMEAVALCVQMGWACLLVGPPASGKTTILKSLAESCNRQLEEIALTPSSDVNELIGTFEQIDAAEVEARLCNNLKDISNFACLTLTTGKAQLKLLEEISSAYYSLVSRMNYLKKSQTSPVVINEKQPMKLVDKLLSSANMASTICDSFKQSCARMILSASKDISSFKSSNKTTDSNAVHFRWFDGVLVQALEKGYWLHLENVNFCPSSVLDRLNPLMEIGGELVLTECGINDDENGTAGTSRVIKAHPNFRLFLSMNPAFGEVSRAMRNRCIEVSLLAPPVSSIGTTRTDNEDPTAVVTSTETLDALDTLFGAGVRSTPLAMAMIKSHLEEFHGHDMAPDDCQPSRNLDELARLSLDSSRRGQNGKSCLSLPLQIAYEIHHEEFMENDGIEDSLRNGNMFEMVEKLFPRHMLERLSTFNSVAKDARLLKTMHDAGDDCLPLGLTSFNQKENLSDEKSLIFNRFASTLVAEDPRIPSIRTYIVANYIRKSQEQDMHLRTRYFDGYSQQISSVMKILGNHFFDANSSSISGHFFTAVCSDRLAQILDERATEINLFDFDAEEHDPSALSIIELSFCIHENKIDRTNVSCPVTPILHPFFISLDSYLDNLQASSLDTAILGRVLEAIAALFESRDRMWKFLKQSHVLPNSSFLGFDESGFLVHWTWLKKRLDSFSAATSSLDNPQFASARRDIDLIVATIDQAVHNQSGDMRLANAFWKRIGHPLVPAKAEDAEAIIGLKNASKTFALLNDEDFGYLRLLSGTSSNISIKTLFELQHDSLLYGPEAKSETLTALSMAYWATTDEMNASTRNERKNYDVVQVNDMLSRKLISAKEEFRTKIQACTIDTDINTVENKLDLEDLEALREEQSREGAEDIMQNLLTTFGTLQLTQLAEFVCIREEEWIIDTMAMLVKEPTPNALMVIAKLRDEVLQRIKDFISTVINDTIWPVSDLRPYQSIVWVIESLSNDVQPIRRLFGSCYSTLIATLSRHHWCNSFNDMNSIAESIESPSFWSIKSSECNKNSDFDDKHEAVAGLLYYSGVPRTNQNVATEFLFRIQGFKRVADASSQAIPYLTLENQEARFGQSRKLANFLSQDLIALRTKTRPSSTLQYLFHNMVEALCDSFECDEDFSTFRDAIQCADGTASSYLVNCKHRTFTKIAEAFLAPLLNTLQKVEHSYSPEAFSEALIYIGILRFHLTLPASPLDPGKKPGAKVAQWDQHLQDLGSKLVTMRMESGLDTGNFDPDNEEVSLVLGALSHCGKKRSKQEKKRVERPRNSPPFYDLFREVHHFAGTVANVDNIAGLVQAISNDASGESYPSNRQKEVNWQSSAVAFHNQITAKYSCFDDVISPCLAALGMIQNGLRGLIHLKGNQEKSFTVATMNLQDHLLQYPNVKLATSFDPMALHDISKSFRASTEINKERFLTEKMEKNSQLSYLLATLANICILRVRRAVSETEFNRVSSYIFAAIADAWNSSSSSTSIEDTKDESDEEKKERQYREQFPDHAKEFNKIIEAVEAIELGGEHYEEEDYNADGSKINEFSVSEEQLSFICDIHKELFSGQNKGSNSDSLRIKSFIATYAAAAQLNNSIVLVDSLEPENKRLGAHCFALGLNAKNDSGSSLNFHSFMKSDTSVDTDFHKDPNPAEVLKADLPLRGLLLRISKLMRAFPGNSILIAIGQVVETMRQMDVKDTSLGKMLTGLEVILKKAQEWEQHASKRVALGESLQRISRLVAQWRKLELQSWSSLLNVRDQTHILRAKRHWMRLYNILVSDEDKPRQDHDLVVSSGYSSPRFPKWLWIGQGKHLHHVTKNSMDTIHSEDHVEMLKVLDTFILTSGIGQFIERLELLQSFAEQLRAEYRIAQVKNDRRLSKALIVDSLVKHYSTFATMIATAKEILRKPIEKKLKDDVKLAKWDEQSYYALTDSAEKSHRKLMMIVHEYEEVLDMSVGRILEEHFLSGVRSNSEVGPGATNQPVTQIPSNSSIFPELKDDKSKPSNKDSSVAIFDAIAKLRIQKRQWVVPDFYPFIGNKMILGIPKYAKKMDRLFTASGDCHAILGQNNATEICDSIFERVNILREKGTKPMKERALVDLFKLLKKQGYSSMKWCVPREIREMTALFQIRSPSTSKLNAKNAEIVDNAESYFRRCTVEVSRLRSEVKMLGSAYMSKREMDLMVGFSEHGLLMLCQQRANLTKSIEDIKNVLNVLQVLDKVNGKLPSGQIHLFQRVQTFDCQYSVVMETIRQTFLMTKSIATLVEDNKSQCIDIIGIVEGGYSLLSDAYNPLNSKALVTSEDVDNIKIAKKQLEVTIYNISSCKEDNQRYRCFPQDAFNPCLDELRIALSHAESCIEDHLIPDSTSSSTPISNQLSEIVKSSLLAAQTLHDGFVQSYEDEPEQDQNDYLWENHSKVLCEWDTLNIQNLGNLLQGLVQGLQAMPQSNAGNVEGVCTDACVLIVKIIDMCQNRLTETMQFYRSVAKFEYVKLRLFRVVIAKGYCADDVEDGGDADGEGGDGNCTFEDDVEGTGMGEGEGKNDVTDQIENEEQLLGLKGDEEKEQQKEDQKQLDEEEAETGMEMENEFDGEMFDVPDKKDDENKDQDEDGEEELDREMGDGSDPNEQVVDEKMWDEDEDDDDEEKNQQEEEKFEKDSKMKGETMEDELRTKEDEEEGKGEEGKEDQTPENAGDNNHDEEAPKNDEDAQDADQDDKDRADDKEEDMVNNDFEEDYEDKHGVDIRDENEGQEPEENEDDAMDLNDEMNLDDGEDGEDAEGEDAGAQIGEEEKDGEDPEDQDDAGGNDNIDENPDAAPENEEDDTDMDTDAVQSAHQTLGDDDQMNADDEEKEEEKEEEQQPEQEPHDMNASDTQQEDAHGVAAKSGSDTVKRPQEEEDDENPEEGQGEEEEQDDGAGEGEEDDKVSGAGQSDANSGEMQDGEQGSGTKPSSTAMDAPNPFRDPGDAEKFWHKKLNVISDAQEDGAEEATTKEEEDKDNNQDETNPDGDFEFTSKEQDNSTQVLGGAAEEESTKLKEEDPQSKSQETKESETMESDAKDEELTRRQTKQEKSRTKESTQEEDVQDEADLPADEADNDQMKDAEMEDVSEESDEESHPDTQEDPPPDPENQIVTDLDQLQVRDALEQNYQTEEMEEEEFHSSITQSEVNDAREKWSELSAETSTLSRRLCEKLRLVMEPLVASKLRGDYRTGKRINMKRVIGYIASGYRKDKIWLRRTKPGKRDYRVLLAVDNSESMKNGAGEMALTALTTLANGMSQLDIGELGIASFGEEMKLLHPFHAPFTSGSGADVVSNFRFGDKRTRTALCVESAMAALESQNNGGSSMQLVFIISDGRVERDSRERLRRIVREMTEKNILVIMVIVEGGKNGKADKEERGKEDKTSRAKKAKDSIINMKEVSFDNGKPKVKHFIDDYPFPYYMVLEDMNTLPEVLGDALKQWFEMMAQNQSQG
jgi:midasin (ATPase involved in ribosome maturation)